MSRTPTSISSTLFFPATINLSLTEMTMSWNNKGRTSIELHLKNRDSLYIYIYILYEEYDNVAHHLLTIYLNILSKHKVAIYTK